MFDKKQFPAKKTRFDDMDDDQVLAILESGEKIPANEHAACSKRINAIRDSVKYTRASSLFERPKGKARGAGPHF